MTSKHTPGPWQIRGCGIVTDSHGVAHAQVSAGNGRADVSSDDAQRANTALIAAAPALLAALESLTQYHDAYGPAGMDTEDADAFFTKARAAIAAARGES